MKAGIVINLDCDNRCIFCSHHFGEEHSSRDFVKKMEIRLLKEIMKFKKSGYREIEISGSDPLQYDKISNLAGWLKDTGFSYVEILTHGRNLSDAGLVNALKAARVDELRIPLYGIDSEIHDSVTNSQGSFRETLDGLDNLRRIAPEIRLTLTTLVLKQNKEQLLKIARLFSEYSENMAFGYPHLREKIEHSKFAVPFQEIREELISLIRFKERTGSNLVLLDIPHCVVGFYRDYIENTNYPPKSLNNLLSIKENSDIPYYRLKVKHDRCVKCRSNNRCDGFLKTYMELFGFGDFPII
jgi:MoaA/NifB/PqqE/SkfB family radical SAM enzyme